MNLRSRQGQTSAVEYAMTFFLVVAILVSMSIMVRRALQARTRDALFFMTETVQDEYTNTFYFQYEPYYMESEMTKVQNDVDGRQETGGVFRYEHGGKTTSSGTQVQYPPAFAD